MIVGYSMMGRSFSYVGIPQAKLFIGEIALGAVLLFRPDALGATLLRRHREPVAMAVNLALMVFILYGLVMVLVAMGGPRAGITVLQNFALHYYTLYLPIGIWLGLREPELLRKLAVPMGWIHGLYGIAYVAVLNRNNIDLQGAHFSPGLYVFGQPGGSAMVILLLLSFSRSLRPVMIPLALNLVVMLAVQVRAEWLGFALAVTVWAVLARQTRRFVAAIGLGIVLLLTAWAADLRVKGLEGRGGELSAQGVVGRIISVVDPDTAAKLIDDADDVGGTVGWRTRWWDNIRREVKRSDDAVFFFGLGYGYPIAELGDGVKPEVRTPHNIVIFTFAYGGAMGVLMMGLFQLSLLLATLRINQKERSDRPAAAVGPAVWVLGLTMAVLGNLLETPFGAIPFYLVLGCAIAPLFSGEKPGNLARSDTQS